MSKRVALSNTGSWALKFDEQDVRGFDALDAEGNKVGEVDSMIVDTDERRVDAIVLEDGTEYPARDVSIGDGVVYLTTVLPDDVAETVTVYDDYGHVIERERVAGANYDAYTDDFRSHYATAFADTGHDYDVYDSAYRYGYESAHEDTYRDRPYRDAEADLERDFTTRYPNKDFNEVRSAVRYGYGYAQRGSS